MKKKLLLAIFTIITLIGYGQNSNLDRSTIQLIRNATVVVKYGGTEFLVDPILADKGTYPGFEGTANSHLRNPLVDLPVPLETLIKPDAVILTHLHLDHWDTVAMNILPKNVPLFAQNNEETTIVQGQGFTNVKTLSKTSTFNGIKLVKTHAQHGTDEAFKNKEFRKSIGKTAGVVFKQEGKPSLYIAGDAVFNDAFYKQLKTLQPDIIVLNTGFAQVDNFGAIIMGKEDVLKAHLAVPTAKIIAVHMDAINHCILSKKELREYVKEKGLEDFVKVPEDGELIEL